MASRTAEENPYRSISSWFDKGNSLNLLFHTRDEDKIQQLYKVDGLHALVKKYFKRRQRKRSRAVNGICTARTGLLLHDQQKDTGKPHRVQRSYGVDAWATLPLSATRSWKAMILINIEFPILNVEVKTGYPGFALQHFRLIICNLLPYFTFNVTWQIHTTSVTISYAPASSVFEVLYPTCVTWDPPPRSVYSAEARYRVVQPDPEAAPSPGSRSWSRRRTISQVETFPAGRWHPPMRRKFALSRPSEAGGDWSDLVPFTAVADPVAPASPVLLSATPAGSNVNLSSRDRSQQLEPEPHLLRWRDSDATFAGAIDISGSDLDRPERHRRTPTDAQALAPGADDDEKKERRRGTGAASKAGRPVRRP